MNITQRTYLHLWPRGCRIALVALYVWCMDWIFKMPKYHFNLCGRVKTPLESFEFVIELARGTFAGYHLHEQRAKDFLGRLLEYWDYA